MSWASLAAGAHSIIVDVHDQASKALCDGQQAMTPLEFADIVYKCKKIAKALGVEIPGAHPSKTRTGS